MEFLEREGLFIPGLVLTLLVVFISVIIGTWSRRLTGNLGDYFVAGRSIGVLNNGLAMVSLILSLVTFIGLTALIIQGLYVAVAIQSALTASFIAILILVAPYLRRHGSFTSMAFISERYYSRTLRIFSVIIMLVVSILFLGGNIKGIGIVFYYLLGVPEVIGILVGGLVVTLYVVLGGMYGVTYNQTFQSIVLLFCLMFPVTIILRQLGAGGWFFPPLGYGDMVPQMLEQVPHYFMPMVVHPVTYLAIGMGAIFGNIGMPHMMMRFFTVRDARVARWSTILSVILVGLVNATVFATGFAAVYFMQTEGITLPEAQYDYMVFILTEALAGEGWLAITIAGSVAAGLSTVAGLLMSMGAGLVHDLYGTIKPGADDKKKLRISYRVMLMVGAGVTLFSLNPPQFILEAVLWAVGIAGASLGVPIVLGIWWKRTTKEGAAAGMITGFFSTFIPCVFILIMGMEPTEIPLPVIAGYLYGPLGWIKLLAFNIPLSFIITVVVSWFTGPPPEEVRRSVDKMHGWHNYREERYNGRGLPVTVVIVSLLIIAFIFTLYDTFANIG